MTKLALILTAAVVAMFAAVAKPERESPVAAAASTAPVTRGESARLLNGLMPGDEIAPRLKKIKASIQALQSPLATKRLQMAWAQTATSNVEKKLDEAKDSIKQNLQ
jgi:hypothetical protein